MTSQNLFADLPDWLPEGLPKRLPEELPEELVEVLAAGAGSLRIERIVSRGHASPAGFWYDEAATEWVLLLRGSAVLRFEDPHEVVTLGPGDWLQIAARRRHRVEATSARSATVWLAVIWE